MKRAISVLVALFAMAGCIFAQSNQSYNLYGQIFGSSTGIGVGVDSRFKTGGILGYSVGLAYTNISWSNDNAIDGSYTSLDVDSYGVSIPVEVNAIMGKRASKFEIGLGFTPYIVKRNEWHYKSVFIPGEDDTWTIENYNTHKKVVRPNIIGTLNIGYRLQRRSGFFMKVGLTLLIGDLKCSPIDGVIPLPNLCLGYTIPHF